MNMVVDISHNLISYLRSPKILFSKIKTIVKIVFNLRRWTVEPYLFHNPRVDFSFFYPRPSSDELNSFYSGGIQNDELSPSEFSELSAFHNSTSLNFWARQILNFAKINHKDPFDGVTIDFGCGSGWLSKALCDDGLLVHVTDVNKSAVDFCKNELKCLGSQIDFSNFQYDEYCFLFSIDVFEHLPDPLSTLKNIFTGLATGGGVVISVPNFNSKLFRLDIRSHLYFAYPAHLNYFSEKSLKVLFQQAGFSNVVVDTTTSTWDKTYNLVPYVKGNYVKSASWKFNDDWDIHGMGEHLLVYALKR